MSTATHSVTTEGNHAVHQMRGSLVLLLIDSGLKGKGKIDELTHERLLTALVGDVLVLRGRGYAGEHKRLAGIGQLDCVVARAEHAIRDIINRKASANGQRTDILHARDIELTRCFRELGLVTLVNNYLALQPDLPSGTLVSDKSGVMRMYGFIGLAHELYGLSVALRLASRLLGLSIEGHAHPQKWKKNGHKRDDHDESASTEGRARRRENGNGKGKKARSQGGMPFLGGGAVKFPQPDALDHFLEERQFKKLAPLKVSAHKEGDEDVAEAYLSEHFVAEGRGGSPEEARRELLKALVVSPEIEH